MPRLVLDVLSHASITYDLTGKLIDGWEVLDKMENLQVLGPAAPKKKLYVFLVGTTPASSTSRFNEYSVVLQSAHQHLYPTVNIDLSTRRSLQELQCMRIPWQTK
jgi:hypothetical protein